MGGIYPGVQQADGRRTEGCRYGSLPKIVDPLEALGAREVHEQGRPLLGPPELGDAVE